MENEHKQTKCPEEEKTIVTADKASNEEPKKPEQGQLLKTAQNIAPKLGVITAIGGVISGVLSFIFGIVMFAQEAGYYELNSKYGGDAYTGIQNATAQTARNVQDLARLTQKGFGFLLIVLGLIAIFYFLSKLKDKD